MKRLLVAGLGLIGTRHARAVQLHRDAELACVVEPDAALRAGYDVPGFASLEDVDVAVDGAILATPSALHADHAEIALSRGWPCMVEKPLAADLPQANRIVAASARTGLPVLTGHHRRYHASVQRLRQIVSGDGIGRPVVATAIWAMKKPDRYFAGNWRQGVDGSPVMINMVHEIDLLRFVIGEVVEVSAMGGQPVRGAGRVESGAFSLRFESGAIATVAFADTAPSPWGFEAGTYENPNIGGTGQDYLWVAGTTGAVSFPSLTVWSGARDWSQAAQPHHQQVAKTNALYAQIGHFLEVLGGSAPLIDAVDAKRTLEVTLKVDGLVAQNERAAWAS